MKLPACTNTLIKQEVMPALFIQLNDPNRKPVSTINTALNVTYKNCIKE